MMTSIICFTSKVKLYSGDRFDFSTVVRGLNFLFVFMSENYSVPGFSKIKLVPSVKKNN